MELTRTGEEGCFDGGRWREEDPQKFKVDKGETTGSDSPESDLDERCVPCTFDPALLQAKAREPRGKREVERTRENVRTESETEDASLCCSRAEHLLRSERKAQGRVQGSPLIISAACATSMSLGRGRMKREKAKRGKPISHFRSSLDPRLAKGEKGVFTLRKCWI